MVKLEYYAQQPAVQIAATLVFLPLEKKNNCPQKGWGEAKAAVASGGGSSSSSNGTSSLGEDKDTVFTSRCG